MKLSVNGEAKRIDVDSITVNGLLAANGVEIPEMVSVQLNGEFVDRNKFNEIGVNEGDEVEFLYFMGGG